MKDISFVNKKEVEELSQAKIVSIDRNKGRVSLFTKNGLVSVGTYLHDINDLREGMTVLIGDLEGSKVILSKISANPKTSNGMSLVQPTIDFSGSFEFSVNISSSNLQCKLPLYNIVNCFINWGDGFIVRIAEWVEGHPVHTYSNAGTYTIQVLGGTYGWYQWIGTVEMENQFRVLSRWGDFSLGKDPGEFHTYRYMTITATDIPKILGSLSSFSQCYSLTNIPNIENWDVSGCTAFFNTFFNTPFDQDVSMWDISNVTNMNNMFYNSAFSTENYEKLLVGWSAQNVKLNVPFHAGDAQYHAAYAPYKQILVDKGWIITDGGQI